MGRNRNAQATLIAGWIKPVIARYGFTSRGIRVPKIKV